ncbi:LacI family DNA-binding transcriptional regulator [Rhodococcus erythropolis]|nr:LacI family DNA-binding transcriptional regulator [Rhodococcus erythropolis]
MAITSKDVARLAGVSQPTVSRALRDQRSVSAQTRRRVREAARQLGYVPSQTGRALSTRRTRRVGVVAAELGNPFYPALVDPLHGALGERGYRMVLLSDDERQSFDVESVLDGSLDAVILTTCHTDSVIPSELRRRGVPFVMVNREADGSVADACVVDNARGARLAADLLVSLGHTRVGLITGPRNTSTGRDRAGAFRECLAGSGTLLDPDLVVVGDFDTKTGDSGLRRLLAGSRPPTAVFCTNDVIAIGALNAAAALGVSVPSQLTLIGFDDISAASYAPLSLTTVHVPLRELARQAVSLLMNRIDDSDAPLTRIVGEPHLVLRGTHARR